MQHMVVYRSADGRPSYFQAEDLDGAMRYVEHLRNAELVNDASIFQMQEVPIEIKTYYRVELAPADVQSGAIVDPMEPSGWQPASESAWPVVEVASAEDEPAIGEFAPPVEVPSSQPQSRFGLFGRG